MKSNDRRLYSGAYGTDSGAYGTASGAYGTSPKWVKSNEHRYIQELKEQIQELMACKVSVNNGHY